MVGGAREGCPRDRVVGVAGAVRVWGEVCLFEVVFVMGEFVFGLGVGGRLSSDGGLLRG